MIRAALKPALALGGFVLLATLLLAGMHALTRDRIAHAQREAERAMLAALLPTGYDNDPASDRVVVPAGPELGLRAPREAWRARRGGSPLGIVLPVVARDGYAGDIELLVGIDAEGRIVGVRVVAHRETPGLGDPIETGRSEWIHRFAERRLGDPAPDRWTVRRDGGDFDQFAGATITPRAVVHAVRRALEFHAAQRETLYAPPAR